MIERRADGWRPWVCLCACGLLQLLSTALLAAPSMPESAAQGVLLSEQITELTLGDAVYLGLRNNPAIRSAYLQRVAQKFELRVAENVFAPKLLISSSYLATRGSEDRSRQALLAPTTSLLSTFGTRLSLAWTQQLSVADQGGRFRSDGIDIGIIQPLLRGGGWDVPTAPLRLARLSEQANLLNLKATVSERVSQIIITYRELLRAQEQLRIAQDALQRARALLEVNRALIEAGRMAAFDIVQTEADIANQELGVEEAANQADNSRLDLLRLLAFDLSTPIQASEALQATPLSIDRDQALRLARLQQPEYLSQLIGSQQADLNLVIAQDQSRWDLSLVTGASQVRDRFDGGRDGDGYGGERRWEGYAGLRVEIPLGDLSTRQAEVNARVAVDEQAVRLADARQALERQVNDVVRDLGTRWRQHQIAERAVELSRRTLEIEREKLNAGRSSNFQVLSFEGDLRNAESARLNALIAYLNVQTQLDRTLGMTLESWQINLND